MLAMLAKYACLWPDNHYIVYFALTITIILQPSVQKMVSGGAELYVV